jgi:hypothetical protein
MKLAAKNEVYEFVQTLLHDDLSVRHLLKSDFVVVNGMLAHYYGIPGVTGEEFRKVPVPAESPRGGLLGMAAILAMGSNGERSSPVERGAWVLRKLWNDPPPPAPANVPQLTRLEDKLLTTRERLRAHQEEPQCASCHRKIDPIGFGLENFDAAGKWREIDRYEAPDNRSAAKQRKQPRGQDAAKEWAIDASGAFHNGPSFRNFVELRDLLAAEPERVSRGLAEALIEYGLGRSYGFSDEELAESIVRRAAEHDNRLRAFIHALAASEAFRTK